MLGTCLNFGTQGCAEMKLHSRLLKRAVIPQWATYSFNLRGPLAKRERRSAPLQEYKPLELVGDVFQPFQVSFPNCQPATCLKQRSRRPGLRFYSGSKESVFSLEIQALVHNLKVWSCRRGELVYKAPYENSTPPQKIRIPARHKP